MPAKYTYDILIVLVCFFHSAGGSGPIRMTDALLKTLDGMIEKSPSGTSDMDTAKLTPEARMGYSHNLIREYGPIPDDSIIAGIYFT